MRPLGSGPELVVLQKWPSSNSISKLLSSPLHILWTATVCNHQSSFVIVLFDINTVLWPKYPEDVRNNVCSFVHNLHKQRNCPDKADQHSHFSYLQPLARCRFCLSKLFLFHFSLISLSRLSSWAALEESQRCLKTERPHRETNNVSPFNKMLANGQHNGWLAKEADKEKSCKMKEEGCRTCLL